MHLKWSAAAIADRTAIFDYIDADRPQAAISVDERIRTQVNRLADFPEIGRPGRVAGTRELVIDRTPYVVAYRIMSDAIVVLRVIHSARR